MPNVAQPFISVVLPTFNSSKYIESAIQSVLNQTYGKLELIIVDDCSQDNTADIIYKFDDRRIKFIYLDANYGNYYCRNLGIRNSNGDFIAVMDSDDISEPTRLEEQLKFFQKHPDYFACGTMISLINEDGYVINHLKNETDYDTIKVKFLLQMELFHPTVMYRREVFSTLNYEYNSSKRYAQDYALLSKLAFHRKIGNVNKHLYKYRKYSDQISQNKKLEQTESFLDAIVDHLQSMGVSVSPERRQLIRLITRNHEKLPVTLKDLLELKKLINDIYQFNSATKHYHNKKLKTFLRQKFLDTYAAFNGNKLDYIKTYFIIDLKILKAFSIIGFLILLKRVKFNFLHRLHSNSLT